jgi:peptide/nickel transport system substrate-binding protein
MFVDGGAWKSGRRSGSMAVGLVGLVLAAAAGLGCTNGDAAPEATFEEETGPRNGGRLVVAVPSEIGDLDPAGAPWSRSDLQVARAVYDRLAVYDDNYQLRPEVAEAITPNEDFTEWIVTLREGIYFHDGRPLDASIVRDNLEAQRSSPSTQALLAPVESIFVRDSLTVGLRMRSPWSTFPHILTGQPGYIAAAPPVAGDEAGSVGVAGPDGPLVGTGPFVVAGRSADGVALTKSSTYWQDGLPRLDGVEFRVVPDEDERREALVERRVDVLLTDDPVQVGELNEAASEGIVQVIDDLEDEDPKLTIAFNTARPPFLDPLARRAVTISTDRQAFGDLRYDGILPPARTPFSEQSLWYNDVALPPRDLSEARGEVEDYELIYGSPLVFTLAVAPEATAMRFAAEWQRQLAETGIVVVIVVQPVDQIRFTASLGEFQAAVLPMFDKWHPDWHYPTFHQAYLTSVGAFGSNYTRFGDELIDEALDAARESGELARQVDQYRVLQDQLAAGESYLFLARLRRVLAAVPDVVDLTQWTTASGDPGLAVEGGAVSLTGAWLDRPPRPAE